MRMHVDTAPDQSFVLSLQHAAVLQRFMNQIYSQMLMFRVLTSGVLGCGLRIKVK